MSCAGGFGCDSHPRLIVVTPGAVTPFVSATAEMQNPDLYNGDHGKEALRRNSAKGVISALQLHVCCLGQENTGKNK